MVKPTVKRTAQPKTLHLTAIQSNTIRPQEVIRNTRSYSQNVEPTASLPHAAQADDDIALNCKLKTLEIGDQSVLLSRMMYAIPQTHARTGEEALACAAKLNHLLTASQAFVIQDANVASQYRLHVETLLFAPFTPKTMAQFLDRIQQDASILLKYFSISK